MPYITIKLSPWASITLYGAEIDKYLAHCQYPLNIVSMGVQA